MIKMKVKEAIEMLEEYDKEEHIIINWYGTMSAQIIAHGVGIELNDEEAQQVIKELDELDLDDADHHDIREMAKHFDAQRIAKNHSLDEGGDKHGA